MPTYKWSDLEDAYGKIEQAALEAEKNRYAGDKQSLPTFIFENLAGGVGGAAETLSSTLLRDALGNETNADVSPEDIENEEYNNLSRNSMRGLLGDINAWGKRTKEAHQHEYTPGSAYYWGSGLLQSLPESAADMGAGALIGAAANTVLGPELAAAGAVLGAGAKLGKYGKRIKQMYDAYNGASNAAKYARALTPSARTLLGGLAQTGVEAEFEKTHAIDDYIEKAKQNGTYIPGQTEEEARQIGQNVFRDNMMLLPLTNTLEQGLTFGKGSLKALRAAGINNPAVRKWLARGVNFGANADIEGVEEVGQDFAQMYEAGEEIDPQKLAESYVSGVLMGGVLNAAGRGAQRLSRIGQGRRASGGDLSDAIAGQESGGDYNAENEDTGAYGKYQIMPGNWSSWAQEAGLPEGAPRTPENQETVARYKLGQYEQKYGKQGAMVAWYAGEGNAQRWLDGEPDAIDDEGNHFAWDAPLSNGPSIQDYVNGVSGRMGAESLGGDFAPYNMPTQGEDITAQVGTLKAGWKNALPQIGGILKNRFGVDAVISSAGRSAEHNAEVGGAENSYHIVRENGGDAVDIVLPDDTPQETLNAIEEYFRSTGMFDEVLFHDVGSGNHLHLGGLNGEGNIGSGSVPSGSMSVDDATLIDFAREKADTMNIADNPNMAEDYNFLNEIAEDGEISPEQRQQMTDVWGDDIEKYIAQRNNGIQQIQQQTNLDVPRTVPSRQATPIIPTRAIETPNLEKAGMSQRVQELKARSVSRTLGIPTKEVREAQRRGTVNQDFTRNTVNDIARQIAQQEAARQQAQAAQSQNLPALLPPGRSQQQAQPTIQTPTGGQMAATTADAIAGQQQAAPVSFLQQPQPAGLQQIIQQIMERSNQNAQNQSIGTAPAQGNQAGRYTDQNAEFGQGSAAAETPSQNQINPAALGAAGQANIGRLIQTIVQGEKAAQNAPQEARKGSTLDATIPGSTNGMTYRQYADLAAKNGGRLETSNGVNRITVGDFGNEVVSQEVADYFKKAKQAREKSAQNPDDGHMEWIRNNPFRYDESKSIDENIAIAEKMAQEYLDKYGETDKIDTPERQELRLRVAKELYGDGATKKEGKVWLIVGLPASGKSTISDPLVEREGALLIDSDKAKELLPEFSNGLLARAVHEESDHIVHAVLGLALQNNDNIVWPIVGKTYSSLQDKIKKFKENGYAVNLVYVDLPIDKAVERVKNRFKEDGRLVSPSYVKKVGLKPKENYDKLKIQKEVDSYEAWNNDVERGLPPKRIEQSAQSEERQDSSRVGGRGDVGRRFQSSDGSRARVPQSERNDSGELNNYETENRSAYQSGFYDGTDTTIVTDEGTEIQARYKLVEAGDLVTSHSAKDFTVNEDYPAELQPRDRQRVGMKQQVRQMVNNLRPDDLGKSRNLNGGAPVINADNVVLNGNGRTIAIVRAQLGQHENGAKYRAWLKVRAEKFGLTPEAVQRMKNPVLVREVAGVLSDDQIQEVVSSTAGGARMGASEQAHADAKKITSDILDTYVQNDTGDLTTAANRDFVSNVLHTIIGKNDINAYTDDNGQVNADGIQRVKRALFAAAYGDDSLISKMAESTDDNIRNVSNALMNAAPTIARLNLKMQEGAAHSYDLSKTIADAVKQFDALRQTGKPVELYLREQQMFSPDTEEMRTVLKFLDDNKRSAKKISAFLRRTAEMIDGMGDPNQTALFETGRESLQEVFNKAISDVKNGGMESLFAQGEKAREESVPKQESKHKKSLIEYERKGQIAPLDAFEKSKGYVDDPWWKQAIAIADKFEKLKQDYKDGIISSTDEMFQKLHDLSAEMRKHGAAIDNNVFFNSSIEQDRGKLDYSGHVENAIAGQQNLLQKQESATPASNNEAKESTWGDETAIMDEMDALLGKPRKSKEKKVTSRVNSVNNALMNDAARFDDQADEILKELQKELNKISANPVFNPKIYELGIKYGMVKIRQGARTFAKWAKEMTDSIGDAIRPWLKSIWQGIMSLPKNQKFDEKRMRNFVQFVGTQYEKGNTTFEAVQDVFIDEYGDRAFRENEDYMLSAYEAVNAYYNPETVMLELEEVSDNELSSDLGDAGRSERSGEGANQDVVGRPNETGRSSEGVSGTGRKTGESGRQAVGESGVRGGSAAARGETGNRGVQSETSGLRDDSAGNTELSGSVVDSYEGHSASALERGAEDPSTVAPEERREHESDTLKQNTETTKAGPREKSIERDLPMLLPEQRGDVAFCENRLLDNGGAGVMLTNGTGTGKTYSGLGLAKRFFDDGKKNILIITKESGVIQQWKDAANDSFGMDAHILESTKDAGKGVTITTYANLGVNDALLSRDWDLVIADESQLLMANAKGETTKALDKVRALTYHNRGLNQRFRSLHAKEYEKLDAIQEKLRKSPNATLEQLADDIRKKLEPLRKEAIAKWKAMDKADKPRMLFLSATPFSRENNTDYVEGYLFDYPEVERSGYNSPSGRDQFMIEHFGYRMRYGKLTKPDAAVDNGVMERQFNEWLKKIGAVSGRTLSIDKDYDRGFLLTPNNEGKAIDAGFDSLQNKKYEHLREYINANFGRKKKHYLLEYLKAKESVPIIKEYLKAGKKVVVFHQSMKEQEVLNPFIVDTSKIPNTGDGVRENIISEYRMFRQEHPELYSLGLENLQSPIETFRNAFGDKAVFYNGTVSKKKRSADKDAFNDDNSGKDIIVVQQDAGNAGVSLHDVTGKHQRVLLQLSIPTRPVYAIQIEGRIFRVGVKTNAIFRYLTTGTDMEKSLFASEVASRSSTAENLSLGNQARALRDSFINLYMETMDGSWERRKPGHEEEGTGGKEMDNAGKNTISEWDMAKSYYYAQQKKTSRNKAAEGQDYYATPEPIGYKMVEWAQAKDGDRMLEPSAGHGAISRWFSPNTKNTIIEPSGKLAPLAEMATDNAQVITSTFENHNIVNKYDAIVMNPPFGTGGKTAVEHLAKAFRHLKDGGRVIAILPDGPSAQKHFDKWFYGNPDAKTKADRGGEPEGVFMKEVLLPGVAFERAGTKVNTRIVVIDKFASEDDRIRATGEAQETVDLRDAKDINELFDRMENLTAPDRNRGASSFSRPVQTTPSNDYGAYGEKNHFLLFDNLAKKASAVELQNPSLRTEKIDSLARSYGGSYDENLQSYLFPYATDPTGSHASTFIHKANELLDNGGESAPQKQTAQESNFTTGDFKHTKTGEMIPQAKLKEQIDNYKEISAIAKRHGGYYSRYSKSFLFKSEKDRDAFVREADTRLSGTKYSTSGEMTEAERMRSEARELSRDEWTPKQKKIADFGEQMGVPVVFIDADPRLHGYHENGVTYLNVNSEIPIHNVYWHESFHWMRNNNPELYSDLIGRMQELGVFPEEDIADYKKSIGRPELTNEEAIEEMLADAMMDKKQREDIMQNVAKSDKNLIERFVAWLRETMKSFQAFMKNPDAGLTRAKIAAMNNELAKFLRRVEDGNGNRIFSVTPKGEIRRYDGRALPAVAYSAKTSEKWDEGLAGNQADRENQNNRKLETVSRKYADIPYRAQEYIQRVTSSDSFARLVRSSEDIGAVCDRAVQNLKGAAEAQISNYLEATNPVQQQRSLDLAAFYVGMVDEIRRDFSEGGQTYKIIAGCRAVRESATAGSNLARSLRDGRRANQGANGKGTAAVDGYSHKAAPVVAKIREQDRGDGIKFSVNLGNKGRSGNQGGFSRGAKKEQSLLDKAKSAFTQKMKLGNDKIKVREMVNDPNALGIMGRYRASPSRMAEKKMSFKPFFEMGDRAMKKLTRLRAELGKELDDSLKLAGGKENREALYRYLWQGDMEQKEYTDAELAEMGASKGVIASYKSVREMLDKVYNLLNDARRRTQTHSERIGSKKLNELKKNKFVEIMDVSEQPDDSQLVTWKEHANWTKEYTVEHEAYEKMKQDDAIQILDEKQIGPDAYTLKVRESIPAVNKLEGYIPHFFHEFMVSVKKADGTIETVGSGRTVREAVKIAEDYQKNLAKGETLLVSPKTFDFNALGLNEKMMAAVLGDKDYEKMVQSIAKNNDMELSEAKELVEGAARKKNRHRFYGNFLHRKGAEGFEKDMDWVLRHHINAASRYVAMETEFKPKAISLFERMFGDFNKEHTGVAQYTKEYINDVNGVPSALEDAINRTLNSNLFWRRFVASRFGDRAALHLANSTTGAVSIMKLGMGNISSALINFTQLANTAAYLGDVSVLYRALQKGAKQKYTDLEKRVLEETNVTYDIGLDSGGGYDRFQPGKLAELSMWPFKKSEEIVRRGTVLAAYEKAIKDGKTHKQAIRYAEEINRKANFDYSVADAPNIFRRGSIFSQLLLQFKKYPIKELEVMADMLPVFSNKTNAKQKAIFWGTYFLLAGLFQIPFGDWLEDLAELARIKPGPTMRKWIMQAAGDSPTGKTLGRMAMYGVGAGVNVDISRRFGLGDVLPSDVSLDSVGGATFSTAKNTAQLIGNVMHGDTGSALANLRGISPGVANIVSAAMGRSYGKRGRLLSEYDSMYDRILKAMGFRSADEAVASDIQSLYYDEKKDRAEEKQRAIDDFLRDGSVENARRLKELGVRPDTVKKERQRKKQNRLSRIEGAMTKQERKDYQDLLKFGR